MKREKGIEGTHGCAPPVAWLAQQGMLSSQDGVIGGCFLSLVLARLRSMRGEARSLVACSLVLYFAPKERMYI